MTKRKKYDEEFISKLHKLAYDYALYKVGSLEVAEDIASQTIYSYLLKQDQVSKNSQEGWIVNACKNYCNQYFELKKAEQNLQQSLTTNLADELQQKITGHSEFPEHEKDTLKDAINEVKGSLTEKELETYFFYLRCERDIKKMHETSSESYSALRQRVWRINRKIKAETFQKLGVIATKKILSPQINDVIMKFILRFKRHLEANTLNKMFYYFSKKDIKTYHHDFQIKKVLDYEVQLSGSIFTIHVVFTNNKDIDESFYFTFTLENNYLKVLQPPTPHQEHMQLSLTDAKQVLALLEEYPEDDQGIHQVPYDELELLRTLLGEDE